MKAIRVRAVWVLAFGVLVAAAGLRLTNLGWAPLSDSEALAALAAAAGTPAQSPFWTSGANGISGGAYTTLTGPLFAVFGGSDALARLVPAIAGLGLVALPLLYVRKLGWPVALGAAGTLTLSTATMSVSRTAGSDALAALAVGLLWIAADSWNKRGLWMPAAGFGFGLALSAGPAFWMGLLGLLLGFVGWRLLSSSAAADDPLQGNLANLMRSEVFAVAGVTFVLLSTRFGFRPAAITDVLSGPGVWLSGWLQGGEYGLGSSLWILLTYEPLLLFGGALGAVAALRSPLRHRQALLYWAAGALLAFLIYPGRSPEHLIWVAVPGSFLVGFALEVALQRYQRTRAWPAPMALMSLLLVLSVFAYFLLQQAGAGVGVLQLSGPEQALFGMAALAFTGVLILLFGMGWSWEDTSLALTSFAGIALALLTLSAGFRLTHNAEAGAAGLWRGRASTMNMNLLSETLEAISNAHIGRPGGLQLALIGEVEPALAWAIREYEPGTAAAAEGDAPPPVILAPEGRDPELPADYLGQAFAVYETPGWIGALPPDPLAWWLDRRAPTEYDSWVLYVRTDVAGLEVGPTFPTEEGN